jgi:hypothetical protein
VTSTTFLQDWICGGRQSARPRQSSPRPNSNRQDSTSDIFEFAKALKPVLMAKRTKGAQFWHTRETSGGVNAALSFLSGRLLECTSVRVCSFTTTLEPLVGFSSTNLLEHGNRHCHGIIYWSRSTHSASCFTSIFVIGCTSQTEALCVPITLVCSKSYNNHPLIRTGVFLFTVLSRSDFFHL